MITSRALRHCAEQGEVDVWDSFSFNKTCLIALEVSATKYLVTCN